MGTVPNVILSNNVLIIFIRLYLRDTRRFSRTLKPFIRIVRLRVIIRITTMRNI